jgi:small subunit ribosomal protein S1
MNYGAFVKLEPGVEGLVHISEMSWTRRINHPSELINVGDTVEVVVLDVTRTSRKSRSA